MPFIVARFGRVVSPSLAVAALAVAALAVAALAVAALALAVDTAAGPIGRAMHGAPRVALGDLGLDAPPSPAAVVCIYMTAASVRVVNIVV
jgi:hypothetical protein